MRIGGKSCAGWVIVARQIGDHIIIDERHSDQILKKTSPVGL